MDIQQQDDGKHGVFQALDNDTGKEKARWRNGVYKGTFCLNL